MTVKLTFRDRLILETAVRAYIDNRYAQANLAHEAGEPEAVAYFQRHAEMAERVLDKICAGQALKPAMMSTEEEMGLV